MSRSIALFLCCLAAVAIAACSSSSESSGPSSPTGLVVPTVNFGMVQPGFVWDTVVAITNAGDQDLTISRNGRGKNVIDTNFQKSISLSPHGYTFMQIGYAPGVDDTGSRTVFDTLYYYSAAGSGTALLPIKATVTTSTAARSGGNGGGGIGSGGNGGGGNGGGGGSVTGPNAGSTFIYHYTSDTNNVPLWSADSTYTVQSNSVSYQGKTSVIKVLHQNGGIDYTHIEGNGDLSIFMDFSQLAALGISIPSSWFTIPIGSKAEIQQTVFDSSISLSGAPFPAQVTVTTDAKYVGSGTVTVQGQGLTCQQGSFVVTVNVGTSGFPLLSIVNTSNVWYSSAIKFVAERKDNTTQSGLLLQLGGGSAGSNSDTYMLKSYNEK